MGAGAVACRSEACGESEGDSTSLESNFEAQFASSSQNDGSPPASFVTDAAAVAAAAAAAQAAAAAAAVQRQPLADVGPPLEAAAPDSGAAHIPPALSRLLEEVDLSPLQSGMSFDSRFNHRKPQQARPPHPDVLSSSSFGVRQLPRLGPPKLDWDGPQSPASHRSRKAKGGVGGGGGGAGHGSWGSVTTAADSSLAGGLAEAEQSDADQDDTLPPDESEAWYLRPGEADEFADQMGGVYFEAADTASWKECFVDAVPVQGLAGMKELKLESHFVDNVYV